MPVQLNAEALEIMQPGADKLDLARMLKLTSQAIDKDEDFLPARNARINALLQLGDMEGLIEEAEAIESIAGNPERQLYVCMAREVAKPDYPGGRGVYIHRKQ